MVENLKLPFCNLTKFLDFLLFTFSFAISWYSQLSYWESLIRDFNVFLGCVSFALKVPLNKKSKQSCRKKKCQGRPESDFRVESSWSAIFPGKVLDKKSKERSMAGCVTIWASWNRSFLITVLMMWRSEKVHLSQNCSLVLFLLKKELWCTLCVNRLWKCKNIWKIYHLCHLTSK